MSEIKFQSGAIIDNRPEEEKLKDFTFEEIVVSINPVNWVEKQPSSWRKFPIFNQNGSGSCVAQTMAKLLGVIYWLKNQVYVHFSATHLYQQRSNKPGTGMFGIDAFELAKKGITLEVLVPSQGMTDTEMDNISIEQYKRDVGSVFKITDYLTLPIKDVETIASIIQTTGKAVMVWFYFQYNEWTDIPNIINSQLELNDPTTCRHSVAAVDFTLYNGKKALIIEDSWGLFGSYAGQRVITEDFYKARNWFSAYPMSFSFDNKSIPKEDITELKHHFNNVLLFGQNSNDVVKLQNILKYEGFFPTNVVSTGFYGSITSKAVLGWQRKHNVADENELNYLQGRRSGEKTIAKLNELYS